MYIDNYRNFVQIVDSGTISAAAKKLHIAQPALSNQVKLLEEKYGSQLLERGPRCVTLTPAGKILYEHAKSIDLLESSLVQEIKDLQSGTVGTLHFGAISTQPEKFSAELLLGFHAIYPNIRFRISEGSSIEIMRLLKDGLIEVGILRSAEPLPEYLEAVFQARANFYAYFTFEQKDLFQDREKEIELQELKDYQIAITAGIQPIFERACLDQGIRPNIIATCASVPTAKMWVKSNNMVAIASSISPEESPGVAFRKIKGTNMKTTHYICVYKERPLSVICSQFIQYCHGAVFGEASAAE